MLDSRDESLTRFVQQSRSVLMISDEYLETTFGGLREALDRGVVGVVTLCLTPDSFTPGWDATEKLAARVLAILGVEFRLPTP